MLVYFTRRYPTWCGRRKQKKETSYGQDQKWQIAGKTRLGEPEDWPEERQAEQGEVGWWPIGTLGEGVADTPSPIFI